jgi:hypothetical protein
MMQAEASLVSPHVRSLSACPRLYTDRGIEAAGRLAVRPGGPGVGAGAGRLEASVDRLWVTRA